MITRLLIRPCYLSLLALGMGLSAFAQQPSDQSNIAGIGWVTHFDRKDFREAALGYQELTFCGENGIFKIPKENWIDLGTWSAVDYRAKLSLLAYIQSKDDPFLDPERPEETRASMVATKRPTFDQAIWETSQKLLKAENPTLVIAIDAHGDNNCLSIGNNFFPDYQQRVDYEAFVTPIVQAARDGIKIRLYLNACHAGSAIHAMESALKYESSLDIEIFGASTSDTLALGNDAWTVLRGVTEIGRMNQGEQHCFDQTDHPLVCQLSMDNKHVLWSSKGNTTKTAKEFPALSTREIFAHYQSLKDPILLTSKNPRFRRYLRRSYLAREEVEPSALEVLAHEFQSAYEFEKANPKSEFAKGPESSRSILLDLFSGKKVGAVILALENTSWVEKLESETSSQLDELSRLASHLANAKASDTDPIFESVASEEKELSLLIEMLKFHRDPERAEKYILDTLATLPEIISKFDIGSYENSNVKAARTAMREVIHSIAKTNRASNRWTWKMLQAYLELLDLDSAGNVWPLSPLVETLIWVNDDRNSALWDQVADWNEKNPSSSASYALLIRFGSKSLKNYSRSGLTLTAEDWERSQEFLEIEFADDKSGKPVLPLPVRVPIIDAIKQLITSKGAANNGRLNREQVANDTRYLNSLAEWADQLVEGRTQNLGKQNTAEAIGQTFKMGFAELNSDQKNQWIDRILQSGVSLLALYDRPNREPKKARVKIEPWEAQLFKSDPSVLWRAKTEKDCEIRLQRFQSLPLKTAGEFYALMFLVNEQEGFREHDVFRVLTRVLTWALPRLSPRDLPIDWMLDSTLRSGTTPTAPWYPNSFVSTALTFLKLADEFVYDYRLIDHPKFWEAVAKYHDQNEADPHYESHRFSRLSPWTVQSYAWRSREWTRAEMEKILQNTRFSSSGRASSGVLNLLTEFSIEGCEQIHTSWAPKAPTNANLITALEVSLDRLTSEQSLHPSLNYLNILKSFFEPLESTVQSTPDQAWLLPRIARAKQRLQGLHALQLHEAKKAELIELNQKK